MNVLWITNCLFPDICNQLGIKPNISGGWQYSSARSLIDLFPHIRLTVVAPHRGRVPKPVTINDITYFLIPAAGNNKTDGSIFKAHLKNIQQESAYDIVHIHGTEHLMGLQYVNLFGNKKVVVSIQGLISVIERYYYGGINEKELRNNITLRDRIKGDTIIKQKRKLQVGAVHEKNLVRLVDHVIGRTSWDQAHLWAINSQANYHFCNEILQDEFYHNHWKLQECEKHTIFLSQAHYPLKGLQQMIKAMPLVLNHYPDTKIYVAGNNFVTNRGWRLNGFGKYIQSLINQHGVAGNIIFTGKLAVKEMCQRYLSSHVFVCPSAIENSSNSIGEAQLLGVPCVAAFVGGMPDLIQNEESGLLYRFEEVEMLAASICRIFANDSLAENLSKQGRASASIRHDKIKNTNALYSIYQSICKSL